MSSPNNIPGFLRGLSAWGIAHGKFEASIVTGVKSFKTTGGHQPWTMEPCAIAERHFTGMVRRAYFLAGSPVSVAAISSVLALR
jgi:hypothetical protein